MKSRTLISRGLRAGVVRGIVSLWVAFGVFGVVLGAAEETRERTESRVDASAPEWRELAERLARSPETRARFEERRFFSVRKEPVVLRGEVRVSRTHGLSLHYTEPEERTIVIDDRGMLLRDARGKDSPPPDPRAGAANAALRQVLRLDLAGLEKEFAVAGRRDGTRWWLELSPRTPGTRRAVGEIFVEGEGGEVRRIELRRSAKQRVEIAMSEIRAVEFGADELKRYFR